MTGVLAPAGRDSLPRAAPVASAVAFLATSADPDGGEVLEFLLHIDGDQAWWRWSDEPFDE